MSKPEKKEPQSVLATIQSIQSGQVDSRFLKKEQRQQCIEVFIGEGYSKVHMAKILRRHPKTIRRDIGEIQIKNSLILKQARFLLNYRIIRLWTSMKTGAAISGSQLAVVDFSDLIQSIFIPV